MDFVTYIKWNNYIQWENLGLNQEIINTFSRVNDSTHILEMYGNTNKYLENSYTHDILRVFDILEKIIIIIRNKDNHYVNVDNILSINLIIENYNFFMFKIEEHNIDYQDDKLVIINFNLKNFVKYENFNIDGLPLFLFDKNLVKVNINFKNKIKFDYNKLFNVYVSGFMIFPEFVKRYLNKELTNQLPYHMLPNEKKKIMEKLKFEYPNDVINYDVKKYLDDKLFNYLNLILYNKTVLDNKIYYNLELEQETTHIVFTFNYEIIDIIWFVIRLDGNDIFDSDIYTLFSNGYFVFKLNSKIPLNSKIKIIVRKKIDTNISIQEINDKIEMKIFNVLDM